MNKNTIIGIVLMVALFIGYGIFQANEIEKQEQIALAQKKKKDAEDAEKFAMAEAKRLAEEAMTPEQRAERDSINRVNAELSKLNTHGETLLAALNGESEILLLENDFLSVVFDSRGGKISEVALKQHTRYDDGERNESVNMMLPGSASFGIDLHREGSAKAVKSNDYLFDTKVEELEKAQRVTMKLQVDPEAYIEYVYTLHKTGEASRDYLIDFTINNHKPFSFMKSNFNAFC